MKKYATSTKYCIEITKGQMLKVLNKDSEALDGHLFELLDKMYGIDEVDYDGTFGPRIFVTVGKDADNKEMWDSIFETINEYIK